MITDIKYSNLTSKQLKVKSAAFLELFGKEPVIYVTGTFSDKSGNAVFLKSCSAQVSHIGIKNMTLWINSDSEMVTVEIPDNDAKYEFSLW